MFTGIIETLGSVAALTPAPGGARLSVRPRSPFEDLAVGESIANNGVCLTAEPGSTPAELRFFLSTETLQRTALGDLRPAATLNLERSLRPDSRIGGHLVMGHVDGVGEVRRFDRSGDAWTLEVNFPPALAPFIAPKGSIAVDGISLTVVDVLDSSFTVAVIPHTAEVTTLRHARPGARLNLEADMLARYVLRALQTLGVDAPAGKDRLTPELLRRAGFMP